MTPAQLAAYVAYLQASVSPRPSWADQANDPNGYIYLRGFNGGMEHALRWIEQNVFHSNGNPLTGEVKEEHQPDDDRMGEYR